MHKDLEDWITQVWKDKQRIFSLSPAGHSGRGIYLFRKNPAVMAIYKMYNSMEQEENSVQAVEGTTVESFIDELDSLEKTAGLEPTVQHSSDFYKLNKGELAGIKSKPVTKKDKSGQHEMPISKQVIGHAFVHFSISRAKATVHRIYINVKTAHAGEVFRSLVTDLAKDPHMASAKVAGPLCRKRSDTIVMYLNDTPGREQVIETIRKYYDKNKNKFEYSTPKLTTPVKDMPGVATAMEPPHLSLVSSGGKYYGQKASQSFGTYRAQLIFMALDRTKSSRPDQSDDDRFDAFKHRVGKYFQQAGIDPDRPAEQSEPKAYLPLSTLEVEIEEIRKPSKQDVGKVKVHIKH